MLKAQKISGVDNEIVNKIIKMIQEKYPQFNLGTYFLATLGYDNDIGFRNIRDMLTHINSAISKGLSFHDREIQIAYAEEHLRRALVEPYEVGASEEFKKTRELYDKFVVLVSSVRKKDKHFLKAPAETQIIEQFHHIHLHMLKGREKKAANLWNSEWEQAIIEFMDATEEAQELNKKLEADIELLSNLNLNRQSRRYFLWGLIATIFGVVISIVGIIIPLLHHSYGVKPK
jgi:hypothetical protein